MTDARLAFYSEADADPAALAGQSIAIIGYGELGRSLALNLRDSEVAVTVGNIADGCRSQAAEDGFTPVPIGDAVTRADIVFVLVADAIIPGCFSQDIAPNLRPGAALCFASGYVLAYHLIEPPGNVDMLLLAPRMPGRQVRRAYLEGSGYVSCLSAEADVTGRARSRLLALARAAGALRRGAYDMPAAKEALLDLLVEQTVGVYLGLGMQLAFRVGVDAGLPAEAMVLELYMSGEMSRTIETFGSEGFFKSVSHHGLTALYGGFARIADVDDEEMERTFRAAAEDIRSGAFAKRLQDEVAAGSPAINTIRGMLSAANPMSEAEARVRRALVLPARARFG